MSDLAACATLHAGGECGRARRVDEGGVVTYGSGTLALVSGFLGLRGVVAQLLSLFSRLVGRKTLDQLALGIHEMLVNAVEHGNLGISLEEKRRALSAQTYDALLRERLCDSSLRRRNVIIDYRITEREALIAITDEGEGFDWRRFTRYTGPPDPLALCGRGILIARGSLDVLSYNERGNRALLVKTLPSLVPGDRFSPSLASLSRQPGGLSWTDSSGGGPAGDSGR